MIHSAMPTELRRAAPTVASPLSPAAYLQLRRKAAGLSIDAVALRISANNQSHARALVCLLETEGSTARYRATIDAFADAFPIDVDVYMQLRDTPVAQHPRICRGCECSEWDSCVGGDGTHTCAWQGLATCTRCVGLPAVPVHQ
ncbi:hypothetical protein [Sphingomonas sp. Leaf38]|uniref:hypothetical protein n=1 Tax=Sphingomonas sp. Leaf38 TaxID=1736217 RepID=UPI0006FE9A72|nr:hypothetical protein [Sphingomonas sp. Leaf38]KQN29688.1 hypothetical protein ASE88_12560 [Sphingomonas sp. Leaf38]